MAEATIDRLEIEIESEASSAVAKVDALYSSLKKLQKITNGFSSNGAGKAIRNIGAAAEKAMPASVQRKRVAVRQATKAASSSGAGRKAQSVKTAVLDASGTTKVDIGEGEKASRGLEDVAAAATRAKGGLDGAANAEKNTTRTSEILHAALSGLGNAFNSVMASGANKFGNAIKNIGKRFTNSFIGPIKNSIAALEKWKKSIGRVAFYRAVRSAIKLVTDGFKEGYENFKAFSDAAGNEFSASLKSISSNALYLKNSLGALAAPLVNSIAPAIDYLIDKFVALINVINMLMSLLSGRGTYFRAVRGAGAATISMGSAMDKVKVASVSAAKSMNDVGIATMSANNSMRGIALASIETKNAMDGIALASVNANDGIAVASNTASEVKDSLSEVGQAANSSGELGKNLSGAADSAKEIRRYLIGIDELNVIPDQSSGGGGGGGGAGGGLDVGGMFEEVPLPDWAQGIKDAIDAGQWYEAGELLADKVNELIDKIDGEAWGRKLGEKIQNGIEFALGFLRNVHWEQLGGEAAGFINGIIDTVNPENLGALLAEKVRIAVDLAYGFINKLKWDKLGDWVGGIINGWFEDINWPKLGMTIGEGVKGLLTAINHALETTDWKQIGIDIGNALKNIDWKGIWDGLLLALENAIDAIGGVAEGLGDSLGTAWDWISLIGTALVSWKISSSVLGWFNNVSNGAFSKQLQSMNTSLAGITAKLAIAITGFTLEFTGIKGIIKNGWNLKDALKTALGTALGVTLTASMFNFTPLGWAISITAALVIALAATVETSYQAKQLEFESSELGQKIKQWKEDAARAEDVTKTINLRLETSMQDYETAASDIEAIKQMIEDAFALDEIEVKTDAQQAKLQALIETINTSGIENVHLDLDPDGKIVQTRDSLLEVTDALIKQAQAEAAMEGYRNAYQAQVEAEANIAMIKQGIADTTALVTQKTQELAVAQEELNTRQNMGWDDEHLKPYLEAVDNAKLGLEGAKDAQEKWNAQIEDAETTLSTANAHADVYVEKLTEGVDAYKDSVSGISESMSGVSDSASEMQKTVADATAGVGGDFATMTDTVTSNNATADTDSSSHWNAIKSLMTENVIAIRTMITSNWDLMKNKVQTTHSNISKNVQTTWTNIKNQITSLGSQIKTQVTNSWNAIKQTTQSSMSAITSSVQSSTNQMKSVMTSAWQSIQSSASQMWSQIKSTVSGAMSSLTSTLQSGMNNVRNNSYSWGRDIASNIASGMRNNSGLVASAANALASTIRSRLHFSEPDEGPLSDFHTYMPDMLKEMARGIRENTGIAVAAANDLAQSISDAFTEAQYAMSFDDFDFDGEYEYSMTGDSDYGGSGYDEYVDVSIDDSSIRESNEEVINALYAMGQRIIEAINSKDTSIILDGNRVGSGVTRVQNRQNRASGRSLSNAYGGA